LMCRTCTRSARDSGRQFPRFQISHTFDSFRPRCSKSSRLGG
jgi:hypothetical protein